MPATPQAPNAAAPAPAPDAPAQGPGPVAPTPDAPPQGPEPATASPAPAQGPLQASPAPAQATAYPAPAPAAPAPSPFAPPHSPPAPPTGGPVGPGGPVNPWAQPGPGYGGMPYSVYPPAAPPANGLAVAALVLGISGIVIGLTPIFFWVGGVLAVTAIGIGIGAVVRAVGGAPRKTMAIIGTVLGLLGLGASAAGLVLTGVIMDKAAAHAPRRMVPDRDYPQDTDPEDAPPPAASPSPSRVPGLTSPLAFGETFTYPNGIKVSLSVPKEYVTSNKYAKVGNAVQMTVTITNGSAAAHDVIYAMPNVRDDQGMTAKLVYDGSVPKMIRGSILPGESASGVVAFEVPEDTTNLSADISAGTTLDNVKFAGPVG
ncbi:hypothetical protein AMK16_14480 [Streptomyces sp. CB00455]|nr:hypothetical protein AMK16_14480 [Streptomyces sp. CB00455]